MASGWVFLAPTNSIHLLVTPWVACLLQVYRSRHDFITDMRLLAQNALQFNGPGHEVYLCASEMRDFVLHDLRDRDEEMGQLESTLGTLEESKASLDESQSEIDRDMEMIASREQASKAQLATHTPHE
eukprot:m.898341 g.898341  ORF g.898341 m.898341 type:complete len:128 (-) comp23673_c0_seq2:163-546(-)